MISDQSELKYFPVNFIQTIFIYLRFSNSLGCTVKTVDGVCCYFPFLYKGSEIHFCIGSGRKWCGTTYNYDQDKKWGRCGGKNFTEAFYKRKARIHNKK